MKELVKSANQASSLVCTLHDENGLLTDRLLQALPTLEINYKQAFISITPTTSSKAEVVKRLEDEPFFVLNFNRGTTTVTRDHYIAGFQNAVRLSGPNQVLHICDVDRLTYALSGYRESFLEDTAHISTSETPLLYLRSETAWNSHPQNYRAIESMVASLGKVLFGKTLDYTWCHAAITARDLQCLLPRLKACDLIYPHTEIAFLLKDKLKTKEVDWLSWEDPFILNRNPEQLKREREADPGETQKRMHYIGPEIEYLLREFQNFQYPKP